MSRRILVAGPRNVRDNASAINKLANHNREGSCNNMNASTRPASEAAAAAEAAQGPAAPEDDASPAPGQPGNININSRPPATPAEVEAADAQKAKEPPAFDAVFTNAALHWVRAPRTMIEGAKRVLRPRGR